MYIHMSRASALVLRKVQACTVATKKTPTWPMHFSDRASLLGSYLSSPPSPPYIYIYIYI